MLAKCPAFSQDAHHPFVVRLSELAQAEPAYANYSTNASSYDGTMARACVVFGPGSIEQVRHRATRPNVQAHQSTEWVSLPELVKMAGIMKRWWKIA